MMQTPLRDGRKSRHEISHADSIPPPVGGWNTRDPEANMKPKYALLLDNWFPDTGAVKLRPGATAFCTSVGPNETVKTLCSWKGPASQKLFAFTDAGIYDISAGGAITSVDQAYTNGYACYVNFTTTGGSWMVAVNGTDDMVYTNGSTWTVLASFAINGGGTLLTKDISNINSFKRSLYYIEKNSMSFFYLPIDSITGTVSEFPIGALFTKGGKLVAMGTWTIDGAAGQDDYSVFITDQGQAAVYQGTDPSSTTTWALKGIYDLSPPIGLKCFCKFGGDLLVLTQRGLFSLTRILLDKRQNENAALSDAIGEAFTQAARINGAQEGWEVVEYPSYNALVCNIPQASYGIAHQYVMNTKTGAWCRFKGWDGYSFTFYNNNLYMGMAGKVGQAFVPGNDFDASITAEAKGAFNYYTPRSRLKSWKLLRPMLTIGGTVAVNVALDTDFSDVPEYGAAVFNLTAESRWDAATWDNDKWSAEQAPRNEWVTVAAKDSYCAAVRLRAIARSSTISWSATDTVYELGALVG